jgi:hypothetical protein
MKIGIKGTNYEMKCRGYQYEFGKLYYIDEKGETQSAEENAVMLTSNLPKPKVCGKGGLHYCDTLEQVFKHYSSGRYFEIEILGQVEGDVEKYATNLFKFIKEIPAEEVEKERQNIKDRKVDKQFELETIQKLQTEFPTLILGGSVSLYLHGIRLKRFSNWSGDFDFILPYWQDLSQTKHEDITVEEEEDFFEDEEGYTNDEDFQFHSRYIVNGRKADIRINPKERYEVVEYNGFKYKVAPLLTTVEAKMHYAKGRKGEKHKADVLEMLKDK